MNQARAARVRYINCLVSNSYFWLISFSVFALINRKFKKNTTCARFIILEYLQIIYNYGRVRTSAPVPDNSPFTFAHRSSSRAQTQVFLNEPRSRTDKRGDRCDRSYGSTTIYIRTALTFTHVTCASGARRLRGPRAAAKWSLRELTERAGVRRNYGTTKRARARGGDDDHKLLVYARARSHRRLCCFALVVGN